MHTKPKKNIKHHPTIDLYHHHHNKNNDDNNNNKALAFYKLDSRSNIHTSVITDHKEDHFWSSKEEKIEKKMGSPPENIELKS